MRYAAHVDFSWTSEQRLLVDSVLRLGASTIAPTAHKLDAGVPPALVQAMAELGLLGLLAPLERDGAGLSSVELVLVTEALARADAGVALCVGLHNVLGAGLAWPEALARAVSHEAVGAGACGDDERVVMGLAPKLVVTARAGGWALVRGAQAVPAPRLGLASAGFARLVGGEVIAEAPMTERNEALCAMVIAASSVGVGRAALSKARAYANERKQFGKAIGEFQAVQWKLADSVTELEAAWSLVVRAAFTGARRDAVMAKLLAAEAAVRATDHALQIHGGYGYVEELGVERYYRDAKSLAGVGGVPDAQRAMIGASFAALPVARPVAPSVKR